MALVLPTGTKTFAVDAAPTISAAALTTVAAKAVEQLTRADLQMLVSAMDRVPGGHAPTAVVGSVLA